MFYNKNTAVMMMMNRILWSTISIRVFLLYTSRFAYSQKTVSTSILFYPLLLSPCSRSRSRSLSFPHSFAGFFVRERLARFYQRRIALRSFPINNTKLTDHVRIINGNSKKRETESEGERTKEKKDEDEAHLLLNLISIKSTICIFGFGLFINKTYRCHSSLKYID